MSNSPKYSLVVAMKVYGENVRKRRKHRRIATMIASAISNYTGGRFRTIEGFVEWYIDHAGVTRPFMRLSITIESDEPFLITHHDLRSAIDSVAGPYLQLSVVDVSHNCVSSYVSTAALPRKIA